MVTKNQIIEVFKWIADNHYMVNEFGYGDEWELTSRTNGDLWRKYPLVWVSADNDTIQGKQVFHSYRVFVADLVKKGEGNELEVESDTFKILCDFIAVLRNKELPYKLNLETEGINITPFTEKSQDSLAGHFARITLKSDYAFDACIAAGEFPTPPPPSPTPPAPIVLTINSETFKTLTSSPYLLEIQNSEAETVGLLDPDNNLVIVPDAVAQINGVNVLNIESGGTKEIKVLQGGVEVGSLIGGEWIVPPCADATINVLDSVGTILKTISAPSGDTTPVTVDNSTATVRNSLNDVVDSASILAEGSADLNAPDAVVENSNQSFQEQIPSNETYELDDYEFELQDENDNIIDTEIRPAMIGETFIVSAGGLCPTTFQYNLNINGVFSQVVTVDINSDININIT